MLYLGKKTFKNQRNSKQKIIIIKRGTVEKLPLFREIWYKINKMKMALRVKLIQTFSQKEHKWDYFLMIKSFIASQKKLLRRSSMCVHKGNCEFMRTYITCYIGSEDRSSRSQIFFKRGVFKISQISQEKKFAGVYF